MSEVIKEPETSEKNCENESFEDEHDPHYDPIISLPKVHVPTLEEDETVMLNLRAKLYRYDSTEVPPEWKERGTGNVKILRHKVQDTVRIVMRRDKTLKLCANHFISPHMKLKPSASCERAWVYSAKDFSDATVKSELFAIKFATVDNAQKWRDVFEEAKKIVANLENSKLEACGDEKAEKVGGSPLLSDTFEEEKKNTVSSVDKKDENTKSSKQSNVEVTEKLSSMSLKSS